MAARNADEEELVTWLRSFSFLDLLPIFEAKGVKTFECLSKVDVEEVTKEVKDDKKREEVRKALVEFQRQYQMIMKLSEEEEEEEKRKKRHKKFNWGIFSSTSSKVYWRDSIL